MSWRNNTDTEFERKKQLGLFSNLRHRLKPVTFRLKNLRKKKFQCPVCRYSGPFMDLSTATGVRMHACCPKCGALERHRLQYLVVMELFRNMDATKMKMLHFAPEHFFRPIFEKRFGKYETADLDAKGVDHNVDIQRLPFADASYDFVFASHVLEHVRDDQKAVAEIRRILKPRGMAVLPVPVLGETTVEYPAPNPKEAGHVRAPGMDYFERYEACFSEVVIKTTESFPGKYQLYIYEDRSAWPTGDFPLRTPTPGERHIDVVPICHA